MMWCPRCGHDKVATFVDNAMKEMEFRGRQCLNKRCELIHDVQVYDTKNGTEISHLMRKSPIGQMVNMDMPPELAELYGRLVWTDGPGVRMGMKES